jgi:OOP family OmpA-OmpF porin
VEQVYWIHKQSSVLLCDVSGVQDSLRDPDLVSGMLSAIQDFVQDSFAGAEEGALEQIEVSGFRVLMAQGPKAVLAVLVRGNPPEELSRDMQATLEKLHRSFSDELQEFDGDVATFERAIPDLQGLLGQGAKPKPASKKGQWLLAAVGVVLVSFLLVNWIQGSRLEGNRARTLAALESTPGYSMQGVASGGEDVQWVGFRDPLAPAWSEVSEFTPEELGVTIRWTPFLSLDPEMVQRRVERQLQAPFGVHVGVEDGVLTLTGEAPAVWVRKALAQAPSIPGVSVVRSRGLIDVDRRAIESEAQALNGLTLPFPRGSAQLDRGKPVVQARLAALKALDDKLAEYGGAWMRLDLQAAFGREELWERGLAERRLVEVQKALGRLGLGATVLEVQPAPGEEGSRSPIAGLRVGVSTLLPKP